MFSTDFCGKVLYNGRMDIEVLKHKIQQKLAVAPQIGAKVKFDLGEDGVFVVDGTVFPAVFHEGDGAEDVGRDADTTFICSSAVLVGIVEGSQDPTMAYMMGKLKIQGSMGYALKLNSFLAD